MGLKLLHSADWHLDSPFAGFSEEQRALLKQEQRKIPGKIADLCRRENCDLVLLAGDLFDGEASRETLDIMKDGLANCGVPVLIAPGNHDFCAPGSPWLEERWPKNVFIFTGGLESVAIMGLDCRVYGAGYQSMDCPGLLEGFQAEGDEKYSIAVLHGDPTQVTSPYCPVTANQVRQSGLHYLALGHIHKTGSLRAGQTLCAWPGCPMGRGFDEQDAKGALVVTLEETAGTAFVPLDTPRFFDHETPPGIDPHATLAALLPALADENFYRVTFTGESPALNLPALQSAFAQFPNLELRDRTVPERDIWGSADADTLEGVYFRLLKDAMRDADEKTCEILTLAARISRQILDGQEVRLP